MYSNIDIKWKSNLSKLLKLVNYKQMHFKTKKIILRLLSVLRGHSVFSSPPQRPMTPNSKDFYTRYYPLHLFSYLNSWERASIFPFQCSVLNNGTTGIIFITSLVWRGPWLGIEPGTSRTRSQHYTTRLSRRR